MRFTFLLKSILFSIGILLLNVSFGQNRLYRQVKDFTPEKSQIMESTRLFQLNVNHTRAETLDEIVKKATFVTLDKTELMRIYKGDIQKLELTLPYNDNNLNVELIRSELFTEDFSVITSDSKGQSVPVKTGVYFRGVLKNDMNSLVTLSIFENEAIGIISTDDGNIVIGALKDSKDGEYIIYNDKDLLVPFSFECNTPDVLPNSQLAEDIKKLSAHNTTGTRTNKCVRMYLELDYTLVTEKGGIQGATNWITAVYNQVQAVFDIDGISTSVSQIFTWTSEDPYNYSSTSEALNRFISERPTYNGDLAHLISRGAPSGGGIAYLNQLCGNLGYAYSHVYSSYQNVPTYSWTVNVIAHETGHNFGSPHTHSCTWPGGAIDGCGPTYNSQYSEGSCAIGPIPSDGGTIMSYCHLLSTGVDLNKGFGYYPALLITQKINNASCLSSSCTTSVNTPTSVQASDGSFTDRVQVTWSGSSGNFFRVYRNTTNSSSTATALGSWQTAFSYDDYNATAGVTYYYFVRAASNSSGSNISAFSTSNAGYRNSAPVVTTPTNVQASDGSFTDRVQVTWSGNSGNFFRVYRNTANSSSTATALGSWQTASSYDDYNATAGVTYYYFVRAASNSSGSNISAFSTSNAGYRNSAPVVTTPTNVQASDGSFTDRVQVTWSGSSGNFFRVYRNTTNSSSTATALGSWQTAFSYDDYNATAGVTYYYFVRAASNSSGSNISSFSTSNAGYRNSAPVVTTPTSVQASDGSFTDRVQVSWSGTSGNFFRVYRNTTNSTTNASVISNWQNEQFFIDDFSALAGTTYFYFVQAASSSAGANASAFSVINSGWRSVAPVVSVPSSVNASDGTYTDRVQVTWSGTSGNFFRVYRNTTNSSTTATALGSWQTASSYDDYNATAGVTYYYFVRAASDISGSNISSFSTSNAGYRNSAPVVTIPTGVQASDGSFTDRVQVTWSGTSGNFFRVYRNTTNSTTNASVISNWQNEQFFIDDFSALAGTTYFYFVQAASSSAGASASAFSVINSGWRSVAPVVSVPTSVNASDGTYSDKVSVTWAGTSGNYFRVIRNTSNSTSVGTVINNWQNTQLYFDDLSAVAGTTYYYFVQAASSSAGANPSSYSVINSGWRSVAPVVSVPSSVNASDGSFTDRVQVTWSGTSGNFFRVYRNTTNSSSTATALGSWQTSFSYDDYNATAGVTYYYFVRAASNSSGSNMSSFSTSNSGYRNTSCGTPTGLQTSQVTSTTCFLNWNAVSGATQYSLWYHNGSSWIQFGTISQNSTYITNMVAGSQYCLAVKAICGGVSSNLSAYVCLIPGFNGDGNTTQSLTTDVNHIPSAPEVTVPDMSVFPNPAIQGSEINLQYSAPTETQAKIIVYDVSGKIVSQLNINIDAGENVINMQAPENAGLYICRMIFQYGSLLQTKLIVH